MSASVLSTGPSCPPLSRTISYIHAGPRCPCKRDTTQVCLSLAVRQLTSSIDSGRSYPGIIFASAQNLVEHFLLLLPKVYVGIIGSGSREGERERWRDGKWVISTCLRDTNAAASPRWAASWPLDWRGGSGRLGSAPEKIEESTTVAPSSAEPNAKVFGSIDLNVIKLCIQRGMFVYIYVYVGKFGSDNTHQQQERKQ